MKTSGAQGGKVSERRASVRIEPLEERALFSTGTITALATLPGITAQDPSGPSSAFTATLVRDSAGNLYGVQPGGGADGFGDIFKVDATTHALTIVHTFEATDGSDPRQLAIDASGNLFGITAEDYGGTITPSVAGGTLFELPGADPNAFRTLQTFDHNDVGSGAAALTLDASGNAYVLLQGVTSGYNTIAEVTPAGATSLVGSIPSYSNFSFRTGEAGSLVLANGNFYGTTLDGGDNSGDGSLFELPAGQTTGITLASLDGTTTGEDPNSTPYVDPQGNVFLLAENGFNNYGSVDEYTAATQTFSAIATFDGNTFSHPEGVLIPDGAGNLIGTTSESGGDTDNGTVFSINTTTHAVTEVADLTSPDGTNSTNGGTPLSGLVAGAAGTYYGVTSDGGANNAGVVFQITTTNSGGGGTTEGGSDLSATIAKSTLPASVVSDAPVKGALSLTITNTSSTAIKGADTISVYASTDGSVNSATQIATITKTLPLKAGASKLVNFKIKTLSLPAGTYTLLAQASDTAGTFTATTGPTLQVAAPFVSLASTVSPVAPAAVKLGKPFTFTLTITNSGNIDSVGAATFAIGLSTDGSTLALPLTTVTKSVKIKASGKPVVVKLKAVLPSDAAVTTYYPFVSFTQGTSTFTAVGATPLTIA